MLIIDQQPPDYSPAYNQQPWVIRETDMTDATITEWRIMITVLNDGNIAIPLATSKLRFRYGTGGRVVFDPMRIVEEQLTFDHTQREYTATPWHTAEGSIMAYKIVAVSQYFDGTRWIGKGAILDVPMKYVYNGTFDPLAFVDYAQANQFIDAKCLTDAPTAQTIGSSDTLWLHTLTDTSTEPTSMEVKTFNSTGGLLATYTYTNPFTDWSGAIVIGSTVYPSAPLKRRRVRVLVGTRDLAALTSPVSFVGAGSYTVRFKDGGSNYIGTTYTFTISDCAKYQTYRLHWFNRLGGFDAYTFRLKSQRVNTIDRMTFGRQPNRLVTRPVSYGYTKASRGDVTYATDIEKKLTLNSDVLTDAEITWLETLAAAPVVYLENNDGTFTAMAMDNKSYQLKQGVQDGTVFVQFDLHYALSDIRQRG